MHFFFNLFIIILINYHQQDICSIFHTPNLFRIIIIMQNLAQIKSRQFHKYATIQPFVRAASNHIIQDQKIHNKHTSLMRSANQNNYHLANVVKQILEMKPKTAQKLGSKKSSRNHKTQSIVQAKPSLQFFCNNAKKNDERMKELNDNEEDKAQKTSLSKQKPHLNFVQIDNRLNSKKVRASKSSRILKREYYRNNIQSINNFESMLDRKDQKQIQQKIDPISKTDDNQCRIRITKRKTQYQIPRSKISIKNLDKLVEMGPRKSENRGKPIKFDLNLPKQPFLGKQFQQDVQIIDIKGWKQKRIKKSITDVKVPQFIKISLEAYQQEPTYLIEQLQKRKIRQLPIEKSQQSYDNRLTQQIAQVKIEKNQQNEPQQDQKLMSNKIILLEKEKKKATNQVEGDLSITNDIILPPSHENKLQKKKFKAKKREQFDQKINICGWEEEDPNIPHYFKL